MFRKLYSILKVCETQLMPLITVIHTMSKITRTDNETSTKILPQAMIIILCNVGALIFIISKFNLIKIRSID